MEIAIFFVVAVFVFALVVVPYLLVPIHSHQTMRQSADPEVLSFPPDHPSLPEEVREHFRHVTIELAALGFEPVEGLALPRQTPGVKAVILLLVNRATKTSAIATVFYADNLVPRLRTAYVELFTRYRDGSLIQVYNSQELGAFPTRPNAKRFQFRMVLDAAKLCRIHMAIVDELGGNSDLFLRLDEEFKGDARAYLAAALREELEVHVGTGYLWLSEREQAFRLTWKGAFLVIWGLLFPLKQLRHARRDRVALQWLANLDRQGKLDV